MTLASYGKRRRGTAGVTGRSRRVPEKPYWEDIKEDDDQNDTVGGKSDYSAPSTPTKKSPKKRAQILETKSPSASTLSRRSRRRKRPRNESEEGTESLGDHLANLDDVDINFASSSSPSSKQQSPAKDGTSKSMEVPKLKLARLDSKSGKSDKMEEVQEGEIQKKPPPPQDKEQNISQSPLEFQQVLETLPRLENMLSGIHAALKLQAGSPQPDSPQRKVSPSTNEGASSMEARQEESIKRLEALCEKQSKAFDELVKQMKVMQANHEKERDALTKEVETFRVVAKAFEEQQSSNSILLNKMEKLEASLSDKQAEQQNLSNQLLELASNSKKQDIFLLERNVKIQELMEANNSVKSKYEGKIKELTVALRKSESKVQELETENRQFKSMLTNFHASLTGATNATSEPKENSAHSSPQAGNKTPKKQMPKNKPKSPSTTAKSTEESSSVTKRQTRSAKKASSVSVLPLSLEHANIIELPASPFDAMGRYKGGTTSSPSRQRSSPSRGPNNRSSPSRLSRSSKKLASSSSNSIGSSSSSKGRRRRYSKIPVPTFDSLSGINPGEDVMSP